MQFLFNLHNYIKYRARINNQLYGIIMIMLIRSRGSIGNEEEERIECTVRSNPISPRIPRESLKEAVWEVANLTTVFYPDSLNISGM